MLLGYLCALIYGGVKGIANLPGFIPLGHTLQHSVVNGLLHQQAGWFGALFALAGEHGHKGALDGPVQVGSVGKDQIGGFSTQFQTERFKVGVGRVMDQLAAYTSAAGKSHLVHQGMAGDVGTDGTFTNNEVDDTGRQEVSLVEDLKQPDKGEGCDAMEGFIIRALRMASDYSPPYPWGSSRE